MRRIIAAGVGVATVAAALAAGKGLRSRSAAIQQVDPELRSPALWFRIAVTGLRSLALARRLYAASLPTDSAVTPELRRIPGQHPGQWIELLLVAPPDQPVRAGCVLWLHGGGFVMGSPESDVAAAGKLAADLGVLVALPRYRLAPEHPFPAGLDDCYAALEWLHASADELGFPPDRIALWGKSAGGGLAAALAQRARDVGGPPIAAQILEYPMLDDRTATSDDHHGRGRFVWTAGSNRYSWQCYLDAAPGSEPTPAWAVPARCDDLTDLPPTWIGVGELDLFYPEDVAYAEGLRAAGVPVELLTVPGMYHAADKVVPAESAPIVRFQRSAESTLGRSLGLAARTAKPTATA